MEKKLGQGFYFQRYLWMIASILGSLILVALFIRFFIVDPGRVNGRSMEPNFVDEQLFFVNKFWYLFHTPERFDLVQTIEPSTRKLIIKRVIGLPGETVVIKRGKVFLRGKDGEETLIDERLYLDESVYTTIIGQNKPLEYVMDENFYFLLGDNRKMSIDSRFYGGVHRTDILGRVLGVHDRMHRPENG